MIIQELKRDIVFGHLKPRERLLEEELSERFGVKRHVVRTALEELDRLGLVRRRPNRGVVVRDYTTAEIEQLYAMREILQREAAARIPLPAPAELVARLTDLNRAFHDALSAGDLDRTAHENDAFHQVLFGACGNEFLAESIQHFWLKTAAIHCYAIGNPNLAVRSHQEHEAMIDALARGDRERLVRICIEHMMPALEAYKAAQGNWTP